MGRKPIGNVLFARRIPKPIADMLGEWLDGNREFMEAVRQMDPETQKLEFIRVLAPTPTPVDQMPVKAKETGFLPIPVEESVELKRLRLENEALKRKLKEYEDMYRGS